MQTGPSEDERMVMVNDDDALIDNRTNKFEQGLTPPRKSSKKGPENLFRKKDNFLRDTVGWWNLLK